jgi:hypothetical protein
MVQLSINEGCLPPTTAGEDPHGVDATVRKQVTQGERATQEDAALLDLAHISGSDPPGASDIDPINSLRHVMEHRGPLGGGVALR